MQLLLQHVLLGQYGFDLHAVSLGHYGDGNLAQRSAWKVIPNSAWRQLQHGSPAKFRAQKNGKADGIIWTAGTQNGQ